MSKQNKILELANQIISLISSHNTDTSAHTNLFNNKEDKSNKNTNLNSQSTHTQYPTSKTVYDALSGCVKTSDSRLSDARTPKSHTHTKAEISDFPTSMTPTSHTHSYLPLSGGTMSGPIRYPQLRSSGTEDNVPYAGQFNWNANILTTLKERKSLIGTTTDGSNWWSVISVRHRNGFNDGNAWGMHIRTPLTTNTSEANANLYWQRDLNGVATNERILIDNENMVKNDVVNNVLSRATNNQSATGWFKILTIKIQGGYSDSNIKFSINRRGQPTTNIELYFQYYKKDSTSSDFYYRLNKCYYDGQPHDTWVKQTVDNVGTGTFDVYIYAEGWADTSITPVITNNDRLTKNQLIITPVNTFVTSLPSGCIQAVKNPNYVADNDSRLTNARTPTSHTDSNGAYGKATTSVWGHTKLNSATNSTDETTAATPKAVKAAYDLANGKITNGTGTVTSTNIADKTIVNGDIADNAAIAYSKLSGVVSSTDSRLSNARTPIFNHIDASSSVAKNLNDYKTGGFYYTQSNANDVPYVANRPDNRNFAFFLLVETWGTNSNYVKQTLTYYDTGTTYTRTCNNNNWSAWTALIREGDSRLSNARTPTAHASTATTYGASSASNYGHSMASSTSPKAPGTANVGSETAKFARGDHVHPLQSSTTTTLSLVNTAAMSGTVKCTESNGWGIVYFEALSCTNTTTSYIPFATLPHTSKAKVYANFNMYTADGILLRVDNNQLQGRVIDANQNMYGSIVYPIA